MRDILAASGSLTVDELASRSGARPADVCRWLADELAAGRVLYLPFGSGQWMTMNPEREPAGLFDGIEGVCE